MKLYDSGVYLVNGKEIMTDATEVQQKTGKAVTKEQAAENTIAYGILKKHNTSGNMDKLQVRFDKLTSHDITFVGIIQTARASGLERFPMPYVLTNCHNSLCAVGGTINEDDHMFGLTCAKKYGGVYVPPHQAVIHQFAREMLAESGAMILGSDSHTRYGALGTMAVGEGGPELVKQLLNKTNDIDMTGVVGLYLNGAPQKGVGHQDLALTIIGDKGCIFCQNCDLVFCFFVDIRRRPKVPKSSLILPHRSVPVRTVLLPSHMSQQSRILLPTALIPHRSFPWPS